LLRSASKRIVCVFSIFLFFVLISLFYPRYTSAEWSRYWANPVLPGPVSSWDSQHSMPGSVIYEDGKYKFWYTGNDGSGWRIGYAESESGVDNWTKSSSPVMAVGSFDGWERGSGDPFVLHDGDLYKMWFTSVGDAWQYGPDRFRAGYATSSDGLTWTKHSGWIITGTPGSWDSGGITRGISVVKSENGYKAWFAAVNSEMMGTEAEEWGIGYAHSSDGINWEKYPDPVITPTEDWEFNYVSYPYVVFDGEYYHMWYSATELNLPIRLAYAYSLDGINWIKEGLDNPIISLGPPGTFDDTHVCSPVPIRIGSIIRLYYAGFNGNNWRIGFAEGELPQLTPLKDKIIFLPGLGASWNHLGMVTGVDPGQQYWQMTPWVHLYDGLIQTLKNADYVTEGENRDLFVFNYNWTQRVSESVEDLHSYISNVVKPKPGQKIDLIGHSLGGLVSRVYYQTYPDSPIDQVISLGSPHQGVPHVYYAWEGGDYNTSLAGWPAIQRFGLGLIVNIRKHKFESLKSAVRGVAPVIEDLLPTFDYLKENSQVKPEANMTWKNEWLKLKNSQADAGLLDIFRPFSGVLATDNTTRWIHVKPRGWIDTLFDDWVDGVPTGQAEMDDGDNTVLDLSSVLSGASVVRFADFDHLELVTESASLQKITEILGLSPSAVVAGNNQKGPLLVFQLASPATLSVACPASCEQAEADNMVVVTNAPNGEYLIEIEGTGNGVYHLYSGQIGNKGDIWDEQIGEITTGETKSFRLVFDSENPNPSPFPTGQGNYLGKVRALLADLEETFQKANTNRLSKAVIFLETKSFRYLLSLRKTEDALEVSYRLKKSILSLYIDGKLDKDVAVYANNILMEIIANLEKYYLSGLQNQLKEYDSRKLNNERAQAEELVDLAEAKLKNEQVNDLGPILGADFLLASDKLEKARTTASWEAHINAIGAKNLAGEILSHVE